MTIYYPHSEVRKGVVTIGERHTGKGAALIDATGDIAFGNDIIFAGGCRIYTHTHFMARDRTIREQTEEMGVRFSNLVVGDDVFFGAECIVLESVQNIPTGVVISAGAVLTHDPECEYGIYAGVPARKVGERQ